MIILDTNVVSEVMRSPSAGPVAMWMKQQPLNLVCTTAITVAEILHGIELLPAGKRRNDLTASFRDFIDRGFQHRILPFDAAAAAEYAAIKVYRRRLGRRIGDFDAQIAAIARSQRADIASRDASGFADCGIGIVDPWS